MAEVITPEKKPLFYGQKIVQKSSFFQAHKKLLVISGLLLFILVVVGLAFFFLGSEYSEQLAEKVSLFVPFFFRKD